MKRCKLEHDVPCWDGLFVRGVDKTGSVYVWVAADTLYFTVHTAIESLC